MSVADHAVEKEVSVVIPAYNASKTIVEQLVALNEQVRNKIFTLNTKWEVIVADNGSDDDTALIVSDFLRKNPEFPGRLIHADLRRGPAHARNAALLQAQGKYIFFCDADDVVSSEWISTGLNHLQELAQSGRPHDAIGGGLRPPKKIPESAGDWRPTSSIQKIINGTGIITCNAAVPRSTLLEVGGFDESLPRYGSEDTELSIRINKMGYRCHNKSDFWIYYSTPSSFKVKIYKNFLIAKSEVLCWKRHQDLFKSNLGFSGIINDFNIFKKYYYRAKSEKRIAPILRASVVILGHRWGSFIYTISRPSPIHPLGKN
ncbi:glycosyltransferase [Rothia nasimurium]|uniref:glycosyltransferase n=1 Tax=Rothia nasimurium TaxID=85336 RepID=UPI001F28C10F|nr:glycosyltransferase [Rothia nasimurium]